VFLLQAGQTRFRRPVGIPGNALGGIPSTDADGRILLPSSDGLLIHDPKGWQKIGRSAGLRGAVYAAFEDRQHSLWIGMAGVALFSGADTRNGRVIHRRAASGAILCTKSFPKPMA